MKFETKVNLQLQKRYFDEGYGVTSYLKLPITIFGIGGAISGEFGNIILMVIFYGIFCYIFGRLMIKHRWTEASIEVNNRLDLFVKEMRKKLKNRNI